MSRFKICDYAYIALLLCAMAFFGWKIFGPLHVDNSPVNCSRSADHVNLPERAEPETVSQMKIGETAELDSVYFDEHGRPFVDANGTVNKDYSSVIRYHNVITRGADGYCIRLDKHDHMAF